MHMGAQSKQTGDYQRHFTGYLVEITDSGIAAFIFNIRFVLVGSNPGEMKTLWRCELSIYESYSQTIHFHIHQHSALMHLNSSISNSSSNLNNGSGILDMVVTSFFYDDFNRLYFSIRI